MTDEELFARKAEERNNARAARCALSPDLRRSNARAAALKLVSLRDVRLARVVMAYAANAEEIDPAPAVAALRERGVTIVMPRIEAPGVLGVHVVASDDDLEAGPLGIKQPREDAPRIPLDAIDVVVVPGVAFDDVGCRLGYGGGYYDRLLPRLSEDTALIGYAYDEQVVKRLPREEHDHLMTFVVTPTRVILACPIENRC